MEEQKDYIKKIFDLAKLSFAFGRINRMTFYEDAIRPESDTDHTFMLSLLACSLADSLYKDNLDIGLVSQFAGIHDLVEVYSGDTDSLVNSSEEAKKEKEKKEYESLERIKKEFGLEFPYIHKTIEKYELQDTPEARFVKLLDKILPKVTSILNNAFAIKIRKTKDEYKTFTDEQLFLYEDYIEEFPELLVFFEEFNKKTLDCFND
jgi:putative hydrolase of HD superfamily